MYQGGREQLFAGTEDYCTSPITHNVNIHTVKWMMIKKHTPEGNTLSKANISGINTSLPWKLCTLHDSRESQLRQTILIFIDNMITGVFLIISLL